MATSPNTQPIFLKTPSIYQVKLVTEVTPRLPTTETPVLLLTAPDPGFLIEAITVMALGINVKSCLRLYIEDATITGGAKWLFQEVTLPAVTAAPADDVCTTSPANAYPLKITLPKILAPASPDPTKPNDGLRVPSGASIRVALGTAVAAGYIITAVGGKYA